MPHGMRSPKPQPTPPTALSKELLFEVAEGLLSFDLATQRTTVARVLHPAVQFTNPLLKLDAVGRCCVLCCALQLEGRWNLFKVLHADIALFDIKVVPLEAVVDHEQLKTVVWFDQYLRPRVPLRSWIFPEAKCPTFMVMTWARQADGTLMVVRLDEHYSTSYLATLFGPMGTWTHGNVIQPAAKWGLDRAADLLDFGAACAAFAAKQLHPATSSNVTANTMSTPPATNAAPNTATAGMTGHANAALHGSEASHNHSGMAHSALARSA
ncbi:hypothetical protein QJQ45_017460 [Haematococcus lacustris]|nr:hypothetical protein QJQ45_017460 [Haematococcus lacustris]